MYEGVIEYISIPWENHSGGDIESLETWTINLALWFVHVLVGNNYQAQPEYISLEAEDLREASLPVLESEASPNLVEARSSSRQIVPEEEDRASDSDDSDKTRPLWETPSKKRGRDDDLEEPYELSFHTPSKRPSRRELLTHAIKD